MEFKLVEMAGEELNIYDVFRHIKGDLDNPRGTLETFKITALIYKESRRSSVRNEDGGRFKGSLVGKALKDARLKIEDIIIVDDYKYKIVELQPRIYADFVEFRLELIYEE